MLAKVMVENGFTIEAASRLIEKTKREGRLVEDKNQVDNSQAPVAGTKS